MGNWEREMKKQKIGWQREDVRFYTRNHNMYVKMLNEHCAKSHNGSFDKSCEKCLAWKRLISQTSQIVGDAKKSIRGILRGE